MSFDQRAFRVDCGHFERIMVVALNMA